MQFVGKEGVLAVLSERAEMERPVCEAIARGGARLELSGHYMMELGLRVVEDGQTVGYVTIMADVSDAIDVRKIVPMEMVGLYADD